MRSPRLRVAAYCLAAGWVATTAAAVASLLVDSTTAKRITWVVVGVAVTVAAGARRALHDLKEN